MQELNLFREENLPGLCITFQDEWITKYNLRAFENVYVLAR